MKKISKEEKESKKKLKKCIMMQRQIHMHILELHKNPKPEALISTKNLEGRKKCPDLP